MPAESSGFGPGETKKNQNCPLHPVWYAPVMLAKAQILQRQDGFFHLSGFSRDIEKGYQICCSELLLMCTCFRLMIKLENG